MFRFEAPPWRSCALRYADSFRSRLVGLLPVPDEVGLVLRSRSIHTVGMRVPLHVTWLSAWGQVVNTARVDPGRLVGCRSARWVMETAVDHGLPPMGAVVKIVPIVGVCPAFSFSAPPR